jgi:Ca-activated chloride channel family protein
MAKLIALCRCHISHSTHLDRIIVLIKAVEARVTIVNSVAQVDLLQTFQSDVDAPLEATYSFPVPASAAVFAFSFTREDGTEVLGVCKEKEQAKQEYDDAVAEGRVAALGAEQTKDCALC